MELLQNILTFRCLQINIGLLYLCGYVIASEETEDGIPVSFSDFGVYYSVETVLRGLRNESVSNLTCVKDILETFDFINRTRADSSPLNPNRHPFIVIEGSRKTSRKAFAKLLTTNLGAKLIAGFPGHIRNLRDEFVKDTYLKRLYFGISVYINSLTIRSLLNLHPVVLEGYWMENAGYHIAKFYDSNPPDKDSAIYEFPKDLLKPDLVFFLNACEIEKEMKYQIFTKNLGEVFRRFRNPGVHEVYQTYISQLDLHMLRLVIKEKLGDKFKHLSYL